MFLITLFIKRNKGGLKKVLSINFWPLFAHVYTDTHSKCVLTKLWTSRPLPSWFWLGSEQPWRENKVSCHVIEMDRRSHHLWEGRCCGNKVWSWWWHCASTSALSPQAAAPGKAVKSWSDADAFIDLELVCEWNGHREIHDLECNTEESPEPVQMFCSLRFRNVSKSLR